MNPTVEEMADAFAKVLTQVEIRPSHLWASIDTFLEWRHLLILRAYTKSSPSSRACITSLFVIRRLCLTSMPKRNTFSRKEYRFLLNWIKK